MKKLLLALFVATGIQADGGPCGTSSSCSTNCDTYEETRYQAEKEEYDQCEFIGKAAFETLPLTTGIISALLLKYPGDNLIADCILSLVGIGYIGKKFDDFCNHLPYHRKYEDEIATVTGFFIKNTAKIVGLFILGFAATNKLKAVLK